MQRVLLWTTLSVLTLVTGGMGLIQHKSETDPNSTLKDHISKGGSTVLYPWLRAFFSSVAFFFVSFLTPPAPQCLIPLTPIPSNAAWIVAVLLGSIMTLGALVFPTDAVALRKGNEARDAEVSVLLDTDDDLPAALPLGCIHLHSRIPVQTTYVSASLYLDTLAPPQNAGCFAGCQPERTAPHTHRPCSRRSSRQRSNFFNGSGA